MKSRSWCTLGKIRKVLPIVWLAAVLLSVPTFNVMTTEVSVFHNNDTSVNLVFCTDHGVEASGRLAFSVYQFLAMFVLPTTIMIFCYARVIYVLWISSRELMNMTSHESKSTHPLTESGYQDSNCSSDSPVSSKQRNSIVTTKQSRDHSMEILKARKQVIKMLLTIIIVFLICWGPKVFFKLIGRADPSIMFHPAAFNVKIVLDCLPYVQSCLNPIIYGFMSKNFRRSMRTACMTYVCRRGYCVMCCVSRQRLEDIEMESRTVNGTIATKMSMLQSSSSKSDPN